MSCVPTVFRIDSHIISETAMTLSLLGTLRVVFGSLDDGLINSRELSNQWNAVAVQWTHTFLIISLRRWTSHESIIFSLTYTFTSFLP